MKTFAQICQELAPAEHSSNSTPSTSLLANWTTDLAPEMALVCCALDAMPNDGPFDDRHRWVELAYAAHGASLGDPTIEQAFIDFSDRWHLGGVAGAAERLWESITAPKTGWSHLKQIAREVDERIARELQQHEAYLVFGNVDPEDVGAAHLPIWVQEMNARFALVRSINGVLDLAATGSAPFIVLPTNGFRVFENGRRKVATGPKGRLLGIGTAWLDRFADAAHHT